MQKNVEFYSEGSLLKGILTLPGDFTEEKQYPALILCHGFAGFKEMLLPPFAQRFSESGFVVLTFDYRGFGESEGDRGKLSPREQIVDIRNALTYLCSLNYVDSNRVGLWGTSYGGANTIVTSSMDKRVKCLAVQLTFGNGERVITNGLSEEEKNRLYETLNKIWVKTVTNNRGMAMTLDKILTDEQSKEFYNKYIEKFPQLKVKIPFLTTRETIEFKPEDHLSAVKIPILIVGAGNDKVNPQKESQILYEKANSPKELYMVEGAGHYEVYEGEYFKRVADKQAEWFEKYLR